MKRVITIGVLGALAYIGVQIYSLSNNLDRVRSEDPLVWSEEIAAFANAAPGPANALLFVGSSSIRRWVDLAEHMAPVPVINRGFGGSKIGDVIYHSEVLFQAESPLAIVIFVGTNDITPGGSKPLGVMVDAFEQMMDGVRRQHPETPVYYIAITPSPLRWEVWDEAQAINRAISDLADGMANTYVIDTASQLMSAGVPDDNNYVFDRLHLSEQGYAIWADIIRSRIFSDLNL